MDNHFLQVFLNILYPEPSACPLCGRKSYQKGEFCALCLQEIKGGRHRYQSCGSCGRLTETTTFSSNVGKLKHIFCGDCQRELPPFRLARAVGPYAGVLKEAVHMLKYTGRYGIARTLSELMAHTILDEPDYGPLDMIVSVPLHPRRLRERTYNQAQLLAAGLGKILGVPEISNTLVKYRDTHAQVGLSRKERLQNLSGTFKVSAPASIAKGQLLLVDDIFTTGSTVTECTRVLLEAGAQTVSVITVATGLFGGSLKITSAKE